MKLNKTSLIKHTRTYESKQLWNTKTSFEAQYPINDDFIQAKSYREDLEEQECSIIISKDKYSIKEM